MADTSTPKRSMAPIPTVAEVRDIVAAARNATGDGQVWLLGPIDALLARLDPDKMAIVTVESLAEALHTFLCSGGWCSCEADATALMHALTTASEGGSGSKRGEK